MAMPYEEAYMESRVYSATPAELIHILYEAALEAVREAGREHAAGNIAGRARAIGRASSCVMELAGSLNVELGGELGVRLAVLYEYLLHELLEAGAGRAEPALSTCEQVLSALWEGWGKALEQMPADAPGSDYPHAETRPVAVMTGAAARATEFSDEHEVSRTSVELEEERVSWCA